MSRSDYTEHIARVSLGKDSLKMLDVIHTRGLPLDRITTTDVWATDTIPAWLPPMQAFRDRMDQWIWERYHIELEHLCARNKDGSKKTYEQMFYHIPQRRSQNVQVERERDGLRPSRLQKTGNNHGIPSKHRIQLLPETQNCARTTSTDFRWQRELHGVKNSRPECRLQGFPAQKSSWCKKLKIDYVRTPFPIAPPRGAEKQISWSIWELQQMNRSALIS